MAQLTHTVIGQKALLQQLDELVQSGRMPHALLFTGPEGSGLLAVALHVAEALLCQSADVHSRPCGECPQCRMLRTWQHPDLHFSFPTYKPKGTSSDYKPVSDDFIKKWQQLLSRGTYFTLNEWLSEIEIENQQSIITVAESDALSRKLSLMSSQGGYKVVVMWLPERMNDAAANKLLKLLEEPPAQTVFLLVSEHPERLIDTIVSRTQRISVPRLTHDDIEEALTQQRGIAPETAQRIARVAAGNWHKALEMLDAESENGEFLDLFITLMRQAYQRDVKALRQWSDQVSSLGREKQRRMLAYFLHLLRENFMYNFRNPQLCYMTEKEEQFATRFARFIHEGNILQMTDKIQTAIRDIGQNANPKIVFFDLSLSIIISIKM